VSALAERLFEATDERTDPPKSSSSTMAAPTEPGLRSSAAARSGATASSGSSTNATRGFRPRGAPGSIAAGGRYTCFLDADLQHPPRRGRDALPKPASVAGGHGPGDPLEHRAAAGLTHAVLARPQPASQHRLSNLATDSKSGFVRSRRTACSKTFFRTAGATATSRRSSALRPSPRDTRFSRSRLCSRAGMPHLVPGGKAWWVSLGALADFPRALIEFGRKRAPYSASIAPKSYPLPRARHPIPWPAALALRGDILRPRRSTSGRSRVGRVHLYLELKQTEQWSRGALEELPAHEAATTPASTHTATSPTTATRSTRPTSNPEEITSIDDLRRLPLLEKDQVRKKLYFHLFADTPPQAGHAPDHDKRFDGRAVHHLRRPLSARDAVRDDAPFTRVDGLALRRPSGAALAPDARDEQVAGDSRAD